jgi:hypothetical protein
VPSVRGMAEFAHPEADEREQVQPVRRVAAPLVVGAADDRAEVEADRVADQVISRLQGGETGETHVHDGCHGIARIAAPSAAPEVGYEGGAISDGLTSRIESKRGTGSALPDDVRSRMESGFGRSLADVRVHTDGESAQLNRSVSARAFTTGNDIFFGAGEFDPGTAAGERVLAHEIAHTQQQGGGARRIHRKWDFDAPRLDWSKAKTVSVHEKKPVWFISDGRDKIVVKSEDNPIGLGELASVLAIQTGASNAIRQRPLDAQDAQALKPLMVEGRITDRDKWDSFGDGMQVGKWTPDTDEEKALKGAAKGLAFTNHVLDNGGFGDGSKLTMSKGEDAADVAKKKTSKGGSNKMLDLCHNREHNRQMGRIAVIDALMGNVDRVLSANSENWMYDGKKVTLIDQVDGANQMAENFAKEVNAAGGWWQKSGHWLAENELDAFATQVATEVCYMAGARDDNLKDKTSPNGKDTWLEYMKRDVYAGIVEQRRRVIKTFTGMTKQKSKKTALKNIKDSADKASASDQGNAKVGNNVDYYSVLYNRVMRVLAG